MGNPLISILLKQTQHLTQAVSDSELLHMYVSRGDQAGFAGLVRRHGPMVWGVCRQALRTEADAEDAFQATFLALVKSARRIRKHDSLGAWLHGVAVRICLKSRQAASRRLTRETKVAMRAGAAKSAETWHDDIVKVHECINTLPKREREVFVLSVLEGIPQTEVARQLKMQINSVSGLLSRARKRLQTQWKASEALSVLALTVAVSAHASVPVALLKQTCGLAVSTSGLSLPVLALTASLVEITMRKALCIAALSLLLGSGLTVGTFFSTAATAQSPPSGKADYQSYAPFTKYTPVQDGTPPPTAYTDAIREYRYPSAGSSGSRWEYKTLLRPAGNHDAEMNTLGEQGWELCSASTGNGPSNQVMLIFKRIKYVTVTSTEKKPPAYTSLKQDSPQDKVLAAKVEYFHFPLKQSKADEVASMIKQIFKQAHVVCDPMTNSIHIQCDAKLETDIRKVIKQLDTTDPTVAPKITR